jgi:hypothetical protein
MNAVLCAVLQGGHQGLHSFYDSVANGIAVSTRKRNLTPGDIELAFAAGADAARFPIIMSPVQLAGLLGLSRKTVDHWIACGRLDGAFRKRGKHNLIWRDRALQIIFNGPDWN